MQVEAVLACQCRVPMERQCLTPTSHPPCDVDYTRYSLLPETINWKHQHRCGLRDLWPFTRAFFRHLQGWGRGMSSSSLFMRNSRIPIHMLADEITNIISIQYSCILGFRMSTWVTQSKRGTIPKPLITPKNNNLHCSGQVYKTNYCFQVCMQHFSANSGLGCCWLSLLLWYITTDATSIIILLWSTISKLWLLVTFNLWNTPVIQQVCDQSSPSSYIIYQSTHSARSFAALCCESHHICFRSLEKIRDLWRQLATVHAVMPERHCIEQKRFSWSDRGCFCIFKWW